MSSYSKVSKKLDNGAILILDGGTGTELEKRGVPMEPGAWCGVAALDHAEILEDIHLDYIKAGSDIITTNTYSTSRSMLQTSGYGESFLEINKKTINAAQRAKIASNLNDLVIAGSLSHRGMIAEETTNANVDSIVKMEDDLTELAFVLKEEGCDLILLEMMYDPDRMQAAFAAAEKTGLPLWAGFSARASAANEILSFKPAINIPIEDIYGILTRFSVDAAGVMHSNSNIINEALTLLKNDFSGPLFAYPDSGYFKSPNWTFKNIITKTELNSFAEEWLQTGAQIIGGCCGLSPGHIQALSHLKNYELKKS